MPSKRIACMFHTKVSITVRYDSVSNVILVRLIPKAEMGRNTNVGRALHGVSYRSPGLGPRSAPVPVITTSVNKACKDRDTTRQTFRDPPAKISVGPNRVGAGLSKISKR